MLCSHWARRLWTWSLFLVPLAFPSHAQESRATIVGRVLDASGAVVPGAEVRILNQETGVGPTIHSNEAGAYLAPFLIPGHYRISCEMRGFKQFRREGLELRVNDRVELNITLEVGDAAETVTVKGEAPLLDTASASAGQVIDARRLAELPMPHGIPFHLIQLSPGVGCVNCVQVTDSPYDSFSQSYAMSGTRAQRSEILVDGVPTSSVNNGPGALITSWVPPADVVAEMKVQTATFDASVGNTEGGAVNVTLKSGTNKLHGTGFYTKMTPELTANTFFSNRAGQPRSNWSYNRWGGTVGGPVVIPKTYNGKDRTFFFYGYEAIHEERLRGITLTVPTERQRQGDFSALLALGSRYQIYDPFTRRAAAGGRFQSDPLPGNVIPASRISPIATNILKYYALPKTQGTADGTNNYPYENALEPVIYYTHMLRLDHNFSPTHRAFVRGNLMKRDSVALDWFHNFTTARPFQFLSSGGIIDDVYSFTPTFIVNVRYGYDRFVRTYDSPVESRGFDLTTLGFPKSWNDAIPADIRRFPYITIEGYAGTFNGVLWRPNETHALSANFTKMAGAHAIKFGVEYRLYRQNEIKPDHESTGNLAFGSTYTRGPLDNSPASPLGQGLASMLFGIPTGGYVDRRDSYAEYSDAWGFHIHDDWKVSPRLTVNLGIRYELEGPIIERFNRSIRGFDPSAALPIEGAVRANYAKSPTPEVPADQFRVRGGLNFAGVGGQPRALWDRDANNFMPRVGLAYSLNRRTVLRAGYGVYFGFLGIRRTNVNQAGFSRRTFLVPSLDGGVTFQATLADPFPNGIESPRGAADRTLTNAGQGISFFNPTPQASYMQRWLFSIQRELPKSILVDVSYVGNRGTHIETNRDLNALPQKYLSTSPVRDDATINYLTQNLPNPFFPLFPNTGLSGSLVPRTTLLLPYPQFGGIGTTTNEGYSWYHSAQAKVERRFSDGFTISGAYTYAKFMEATGFLNIADPRPERVISDQDFTHRVSLSGIYELPFGPGKKWLSNARGAANLFLAGWQVDGTFLGQSGQPLGFGNSIFNGDLKNVPIPNSQRKPERWFNTAAGFDTDTRRALSQNIRTMPTRFSGIRGDGLNNWDLSIIKSMRIRERARVQLRAEALNALNHPMFANPNTTPTSTAFGTITAQKTNPRRVQMTIKAIF